MPRRVSAPVPPSKKRRRASPRASAVKSSQSFILAVAQMCVETGRPDRNLRRALDLIGRAARAGAAVVLLPEAMDVGWTFPGARDLATAVPDGAFCRALSRAAARHRIHVCAGLTERAGPRVYNAAVLISPQGRLLLRHRKLNELGIGHRAYDQGDRLGVVETPHGTWGLMICADARADGECLARSLGMMGADFILSPSAWAVPPDWNPRRRYGIAWRQSYGKVARDYRLWIAGCSNVGAIAAGPWRGYDCIGCSLVVNDRGVPVAQGACGVDAEELRLVTIRPVARPARGDLWREYHARIRARRRARTA